MRKSMFRIIGITIFGCFLSSFANAMNKDSKIENSLATKKDLIETTETNNGLIKKTSEMKKKEVGDIITINLKGSGGLSKYDLKLMYSGIIKALENDFNRKNKMSLENIFKDVEVSSFLGGVSVSFKILYDVGLKEKIEKYFNDLLNSGNIEKLREKIKEIVKDNLRKDDCEKISKKLAKEVEKRIELEKRKDSFFSFGFPKLDGLFKSFDLGDDLLKDEIEEKRRDEVVAELEKIKQKILNFDFYSNVDRAVDYANSIQKTGQYSSEGVAMKQFTTNEN